jgi:hypothetical protein
VSDVTSVSFDLGGGKPSVSSFINEKYPEISSGLDAMDVPGKVSEGADSAFSSIASVVTDIGSQAHNIVQNVSGLAPMVTGGSTSPSTILGDVLGNAGGDTLGFIETASSKVGGVLNSSITGLQKDFFGDFPDVGDAVDHVIPAIQTNIGKAMPNFPTPTKLVDNAVSPGSEFTTLIETDVVWEAVDAINLIDEFLPTTQVPVFDEYTGGLIETQPSAQEQFVMNAMEVITSELNTVSKTLTSVDPADILEEATSILNNNMESILNQVHTDVNKILNLNNKTIPDLGLDLLPPLPNLGDSVTSEISNQVGNVTAIADSLTSALAGLPDNVLGGFDAGFTSAVKQSLDASLATVMPQLPDIDPGDLNDFIQTEVFDTVKAGLLPNVPNFPSSQSVRDLLDTALDSGINDFITNAGFSTVKSSLDSVAGSVTAITDNISGVVDSIGSGILDTGFNALKSNFSISDNVVSDIGNTISNVVPNISSTLNSVLPNIQKSLPDVTGFLNDTAGGLMDTFRSNMPTFASGASEQIGNMVNVFNGFASIDAGNLTGGAQALLSNVNLPMVNIPDVANLQMGKAIQGAMGIMEKIQGAQFGLDCMDKAKEMIPNIEGVTDTFANFSFEGSGFSLGMIGSYFSDADSADEMKAEVMAQLAGAPPVQQATAKMNQALAQANAIKAQVEAKKAEALAAVDTIKEIFELF